MSQDFTLDELLNHPDIHHSAPDKYGIRFFESKKEGLEVHQYRDAAGKKIAGTTSVIGDIVNTNHGFSIAQETDGLIDNLTLRKASERGTRIHKGIEHILKGESIPEGLLEHKDLKHIQSFRKWKEGPAGKAFDWDRVKSEVSGYSKELGVAGTTDILVPYKQLSGGKEVWHAWEIKTTAEIHRGAALQQAANIQQAKENFEEIANAERVDRGILHFPDSGIFKTVSDRKNTGPYKSLAEDTAEFKKLADEYNLNGPKTVSEQRVRELASSKLYEQVHGAPDYKNIYLGINGDGQVDPTAHKIYNEEAEKLGFQLKHEGVSSTGKSNKYSVSKIGDGDPEHLKLAKAVLESSKKKEENSISAKVRKEMAEIKGIDIGETLGSAREIGDKVGSDLLSAISKTHNFKAAAIGGAIGYAGGIAYGALHDTSDPTSTYHEERNMLGNAIKGAVVGASTTFVAAAAMNMRNVESGAGEMVAHIGNSARGFGGKISDVMLGAWRATGRMK